MEAGGKADDRERDDEGQRQGAVMPAAAPVFKPGEARPAAKGCRLSRGMRDRA